MSLIDREWSQKERISYLAERKYKEISESLAYACGSWALHLAHANMQNKSSELEHFFEQHLLQWIDCLSILGKLETAIDSLQ